MVGAHPTGCYGAALPRHGTNPDLAFASLGQDTRLPDRRVLGKFPRSEHRPSLITSPRLKVPAHSDPVKRRNFLKADWMRFCLLTGESVERLPPPDTLKINRAYQDFCESLLSAAKQCFRMLMRYYVIFRSLCRIQTLSRPVRCRMLI